MQTHEFTDRFPIINGMQTHEFTDRFPIINGTLPRKAGHCTLV